MRLLNAYRGAKILYDKLGGKIILVEEVWILTSFGIQRTGSENGSVIDAVVEKNPGSLQDATSEPFADYERTVHLVVGKR